MRKAPFCQTPPLVPLFLFFLLAISLLGLPHPLLASTEFSANTQLKYYKTQHFRVIYDEAVSGEEAHEVGAIAEEVRREVLGSLGIAFNATYDIILLDNYDSANGSANGYPRRVLRLYLTSPTFPLGSPGGITDSIGTTWMRELLVHEYTHAIHLNRLTGWTRVWAWLTHSTPFGIIYPDWFTEGLAVAVETEHGPRGRGKIYSSDMFLRTAVLNEQLLPIGRWSWTQGWPRGGAAYLYGGAFMNYVRNRFGSETLTEIIDANNEQIPYLDDLRFGVLADLADSVGLRSERLAQARAGGLERGFQKATGVPLSELERDWRRLLNTRYQLQSLHISRAGVSSSRASSTCGGTTRAPAVSPDGKEVAYYCGGDSTVPGIEIVPLDGGRPRHLLTQTGLNGNIVWSPDGSSLVYARMFGENQPFFRRVARSDLFEVDIRTGKERRVTRHLRAWDPAFTPDGSTIIAVANDAGRTRLVRMTRNGSEAKTLFAPDRRFKLGTPTVSPDGRRVAMSVFVQQEPPNVGRYAIGLVDMDGQNFRLFSGEGVNAEPDWLDDSHLVFSSDRSGVYNLYALDLQSGKVRGLTNLLTGAFQPRRIPGADGGLIFRGYSSRGYDIHILEPSSDERLALEGRGNGRAIPDVRDLSPGRGDLSPFPTALTGQNWPLSVGIPIGGAKPDGTVAAGAQPEGTPTGSQQSSRAMADQNQTEKAPADTRRRREEEQPETLPMLTPEALSTLRPPVDVDEMRYRPIQGMRFGRYRPIIGWDEGSNIEAYDGGRTVGIATSVYDITGRHNISFQAVIGLESILPSFQASYTNQWLAMPITIQGWSDVYLQSTTEWEEKQYLVWERSRGLGLQAGFPFERGHLSAGLNLGGSHARYHRFHAHDIEGSRGSTDQLSQWFGAGWSVGNTWYTVRGLFFSLNSSQTRVSETSPVPQTPYWRGDLTAATLLRHHAGRGVLDLDLQFGWKRGPDNRFVIGGFEDSWALPGIDLSDGPSGQNVGLQQLRLIQDIWRPEVSLGQVPWLHLKRLEGIVSLGAAQSYDAPVSSGSFAYAASLSLRARMATLRNGLSFAPKVSVAVDMRTGILSWYLTLDNWPGLYTDLLPVGLPGSRP